MDDWSSFDIAIDRTTFAINYGVKDGAKYYCASNIAAASRGAKVSSPIVPFVKERLADFKDAAIRFAVYRKNMLVTTFDQSIHLINRFAEDPQRSPHTDKVIAALKDKN